MVRRDADVTPGSRRALLALFALSLAVRLSFWAFVAVQDMQPRGDEGGYIRRALAAQRVLQMARDGESITLEDAGRWYGGGRWGPLYPLVLALGFEHSDEPVPTARLIVSVVGALTTPLVFALTRRISSRRAAWIAALLHVGYSGFIVFSHLLWSETFFIFLLLLTLLLAHSVKPGAPPGHNLRAAGWTGFALGLAGLVRPTILPFVVLLPLWLAIRHWRTRQRLALPALVLLACLMTLSPWLAWLYAEEGHVVPLATTGSLNLFRAHSPAGIHLADAVAYAKQADADLDCVMRELALTEMKRDPIGVLARGLNRSLHTLWTPEIPLQTHLRLAVYPPVPPPLVAIWFLVALAVYLAIVGLAGFGFRLEIGRLGSSGNLLLWMVLSSLVFPIVMRGGNARLVLVNLALMLPMAGHGAAHLNRWRALSWKLPSLLAILALPLSILSTLGRGVPATTGYYAPLAATWNGWVGRPTRVLDQFELRGAFLERDDRITLRPTSETYRLGPEAKPTWQWDLSPSSQHAPLLVSALDADEPVRLTLTSRNFDRQVELEPVRREAWQRWQPTGLPGIDIRWLPAESIRHVPVFERWHGEAETDTGSAATPSQLRISLPQCLPKR